MKKLIYISYLLVILGIVLELSNENLYLWSSAVILLGFFVSQVNHKVRTVHKTKAVIEANEKIKQKNVEIEEIQKKLDYLSSPEAETYYFEIDYSKSFEELVSQGKYDWKNNDVMGFKQENHEDSKKITKVAAKVFEFKDSVDKEKEKMESLGYRPATSFELLVFGATHSEVQKRFPIMAMGTVSKELYSNSICLCLYNCSSNRQPGQRGLGVHYYVYGTREKNCYLLGIKVLETGQN